MWQELKILELLEFVQVFDEEAGMWVIFRRLMENWVIIRSLLSNLEQDWHILPEIPEF